MTQILKNWVSIPYSSGLSFRGMILEIAKEQAPQSQSLIHQVSVSEETIAKVNGFSFNTSQSLIHQVSVSEHWIYSRGGGWILGLNPLFIRSQFQSIAKSMVLIRIKLSQSLIHQVSVSEGSLFPANKYRYLEQPFL